MTEAEWLACTDVYSMLGLLKGKDTDRKMRLFASSCCRRIWHRLADERYRYTIETAERYVEGEVNESEREEARQKAKAAMLQSDRVNDRDDPAWALRGELVALVVANRVSAYLLMWLFNENALKVNPTGEMAEKMPQADLLRDLFGPLPFRSINFDSRCLTSTILALARTIYNDRAFDHMPILADALEETGCTNADILNHCRQPGKHVRGCWVIDLLLGKE